MYCQCEMNAAPQWWNVPTVGLVVPNYISQVVGIQVREKGCMHVRVKVQHFLNYATSNPNAKIIYQTSDMILQTHSNTAYLVTLYLSILVFVHWQLLLYLRVTQDLSFFITMTKLYSPVLYNNTTHVNYHIQSPVRIEPYED